MNWFPTLCHDILDVEGQLKNKYNKIIHNYNIEFNTITACSNENL